MPTPEQARRAVSLIFLLNGVLFSTWAVNIPVIRTALGLSEAQIGGALLAVGLGSLISMPLTGGWIARWGSHRVTALLAPLALLALLLPFGMPNLTTLALGLGVMGLLNGALDVAMNAQGITVEKALGRPIMSRLHAFFSLGGVAGALLGALLLERVAPAVHVDGVALLSAGAALWAGRQFCPDAPAEQTGADEGAEQPSSLWPALLLGGLCFLGMFAEGTHYDWAALYYRDTLHLGGGLSSLGYAAFVATMTLGRWLGDAARTRFGDVRLVQVGALLSALGLGLARLWPQPVPATLGFALSGLGLSNVVPVMYGAAGHALHGKGIAQVATIGYGGFLLGPPIIGVVAERVGLGRALGLSVLAALLVTGLGGAAFRFLRAERRVL